MALITGLSRERERAVQDALFTRIAGGLEVALQREINRTMNLMAVNRESTGKLAEIKQQHGQRIDRIITRGWQASFDSFGNRIIEGAAKSYKPDSRKAMFGTFEQNAQQWIQRYGAQKVTEITKTTAKQAMNIINAVTAEAVASGLGQAEAGKLIQNAVREKGGTLSRARSRVIARTETHGASQAAVNLAAQSIDLPVKKEWISAGQPGRTRDDHLDADGQVRNINSPFIVGGEELMYPGDPSGSAEQVINCRCVEGVVIGD
jgi:hypothetical protein